MSVNDGLEGKAPSETQLTQTWSTIEKEHVHSHFRKHYKYWDRHPRKAAESCVRNWRQCFPDEADKLPVDKVVEYREYVKKTGQLAHFATAKRHVLAPRVPQPKETVLKSKVPCIAFPPCNEDFVFVEGLVDHILRAHTNRKSMHCDCGETFTRVIDLDAHVGLVHIGSGLGKDLSVRATAGAEVLEGQGQGAEPVSLAQPARTLGSQILFCCTTFPPCSKTFEDEYDLKAHVAKHKGWSTRWANQDGPSARVNKATRIAGTTARTIATPLGVNQPKSPPSQSKGQEAMMIDGVVEPHVTAASLQESRNLQIVVSGENEGAAGVVAVANDTDAKDTGHLELPTADDVSQIGIGLNHPGMRLLPKIEQQLHRSVLRELEEAVVQAPPDPKQIFKHAQTISKRASDAIVKILSPYRYASFVEYRATCLKDVTELSAVVFGDTRDEEILKIVYGIQSQNRLAVETVLQAYTAAAVTQWVLRVDFRDRYRAQGEVCNGPCIRKQSMEEFLKRASPDLYSLLYRKYYHEYLQSEVGRLDSESWRLADKLYHILISLFDGKLGEVEHGSHGCEEVKATDGGMRLSNEVRLLLFQIFREAHELALLMHKHAVGYDVSFPAWPEKYVVEGMRTLEPQYSHLEGQVCICVGPKISYKDPLETIVQASVILM